MRSLRVRSARSLPEKTGLSQHASGRYVDLALINAIAFIAFTIGLKVYAAVLIEEQRRINTALRDRYWIGPWTRRLLTADIEVADPAHIRRHHIEPAVAIAYRRGVDPSREPSVCQ